VRGRTADGLHAGDDHARSAACECVQSRIRCAFPAWLTVKDVPDYHVSGGQEIFGIVQLQRHQGDLGRRSVHIGFDLMAWADSVGITPPGFCAGKACLLFMGIF
jgi:hypothetical protein